MRSTARTRAARGSIFRTMTVILPLAALAACGKERGPTDPRGTQVAAVEVTAPAQTLAVGETMQLAATPRSRSGAAIPGAAVTWSSSDHAIATVSGTGTVAGRAAGQAVIRATSGGRTGEVIVSVSAPGVASIEITPGGEIELPGNGSVQLRAIGRTAAGQSIGELPATWTSSNEQVARVSESGIVHAGFGGTAIVTALAGNRTAQVTVRVRTMIQTVLVLPGGSSLRPGETVQLGARGLTAGRDTLNRPAAWASENEGVATVDALGRVTARRPGSAVIRATIEGVEGRAIVFVHGPTEHRLERAAGRALPAQVGTRTLRDAQGVDREQRVVLTAGVLRFEDGWHERLTLEIYEGGTRVATEVYEDRGEVFYHGIDGYPILYSTVRPGLQLPVQLAYEHGLPTGEMTLAHPLAGLAGTVALRFGKP